MTIVNPTFFQMVKTQHALPYGLAIDTKGFLFFCQFGTHKIGKIDPQSLEITDYELPASVRPRRLAVAPDETVYFTDFKGGNLRRLNPVTKQVMLWASPGGATSGPYGIAITPDGMVWYSESGVKPNTMIRFDPKSQEFARQVIPSGGGTVRNMAATSDGRIYIACSGVNKVGVVEPGR